MRTFRSYTYRDANFRICSSHFESAVSEIKKQRHLLEEYIAQDDSFRTSLKPLPLQKEAPDIVKRMHEASEKTGIGPMAAVAGTFAQLAAEAASVASAEEAIVENGGDMYIISKKPVTVGLYAGDNPLSGTLAFYITPEKMPVALCSSSSNMGHSLSLGKCDLATVVARSAALADAAATLAANSVCKESDIDPTLEKISTIPGIDGALIIKNTKIGMVGDLPELVKQRDSDFLLKITRDRHSDFNL